MERTVQLYEGKAKKVYATDNEDIVLVSYKDDATAFNGIKKGQIYGKGVVNNLMSNHMFRLLEKAGVPTHYVEEVNDRETFVKKVKIVPLEVIVRNIAAGSMAKRYGVEEGRKLACPVLEFSYKDDALGDPMITDSHIFALEIATKEEVDTIKELALKVNAFMVDYFKSLNIDLVDFKLEFGKFHDQIILADEISPDTCRFWDSTTHEKLDKDRFRRDMDDVDKGYREMMKRLGLTK